MDPKEDLRNTNANELFYGKYEQWGFEGVFTFHEYLIMDNQENKTLCLIS